MSPSLWKVVFSKQAQKDAKKIGSAGLRPKVEALLLVLQKNPYDSSSKFEKLVGDFSGFYSRRITIQHRLVYEIYDDLKTVRVVRMWTHYE